MNNQSDIIKRFKEKFDTDIFKYNKNDPVIKFLLEEVERAIDQTIELVTKHECYSSSKYKLIKNLISLKGKAER